MEIVAAPRNPWCKGEKFRNVTRGACKPLQPVTRSPAVWPPHCRRSRPRFSILSGRPRASFDRVTAVRTSNKEASETDESRDLLKFTGHRPFSSSAGVLRATWPIRCVSLPLTGTSFIVMIHFQRDRMQVPSPPIYLRCLHHHMSQMTPFKVQCFTSFLQISSYTHNESHLIALRPVRCFCCSRRCPPPPPGPYPASAKTNLPLNPLPPKPTTPLAAPSPTCPTLITRIPPSLNNGPQISATPPPPTYFHGLWYSTHSSGANVRALKNMWLNSTPNALGGADDVTSYQVPSCAQIFTAFSNSSVPTSEIDLFPLPPGRYPR